MKKLILKHTLINAIEHKGKAEAQAVLGKVIAEKPELKNRVKEIIPDIENIVKKVNSWSLKKQQYELKKLKVKVKRERVKRKELPGLPYAEFGKVVTAFPPEPSKYPHIGHAKTALINYLYAKKYKGKFILRFEDTNPEMVKKEYYNAFLDGLKWLRIEPDRIEYLSDFLEKFYEVTKKLIEDEKAYVCLCPREKIKENRILMKECECRNFDTNKNLELWEKMLTSFKKGEATVRLKIDMKHVNTTLRDPSIMRIVECPHPRTGNKFRVWPMYDYGTALMDAWEGVTHRVRSKEFEIRKELQQHIQKLFGFKIPYIMEIGRLNLEGVPTSGRKIREMIKNKELMGWDDPRLTTLIALKRRGFTPEAIRNFLLLTGVSKAEGTVTWDVLEAENRKIIDSKANRYFAVLSPKEISVKKMPRIKSIKAKLHPDFPKRGYRKIPITSKIYIEKDDFEKFKNKEIRLMDLFNIKLNKQPEFTSRRLKVKIPKIQWVSEPNIKVKIIMPDGSTKTAIAEPSVKDVKIGDVIQFIRVGFAKLDRIEDNIQVFYFTHK